MANKYAKLQRRLILKYGLSQVKTMTLWVLSILLHMRFLSEILFLVLESYDELISPLLGDNFILKKITTVVHPNEVTVHV